MDRAISIIIPAFNEEFGVKKVLSELDQSMKNSGFEYEIIIVNDGSSDNTVLEAASISGIKIINHGNYSPHKKM